MKPYTTVNKGQYDEDLRRNWRSNKNYWRKCKDRPFKKKARKAFQREGFPIWESEVDQ